MMPGIVSRLLSAALVVLLIVQLTSIERSFFVQQQSYGAIKHMQAIAWGSIGSSTPTAFFAASVPARNSLLFVGDVLLARNIESLMMRKGHGYPFEGIDLASFSRIGYVIGNFESAVPETHQPTQVGELRFSVHEKFLPSLRQAGFTHLSLANNHSLDFGTKGFTHTKQVLSENDFVSFGHPTAIDKDSVTFLEVGEMVVALIGIHTLTQKPTDDALANIFAYANTNSDAQIVYIHWGTEYDQQNDHTQRTLAEKLVAAGADLIVGHHPHVVQNVDLVDDVLVFYSLGNYIFDQYFSLETQEGLMLHLDLTARPTIHLIPVTSQTSLSQPRMMQEHEHFLFLQKLAARSDPRLVAGIKRGVLPLDSLVATSSKIAMMVK